MRHVLFAVVLIGASFLGGAFVNGPGLKWLQIKVLGHAGLSEEVPSVTLASNPNPDSDESAGSNSGSNASDESAPSPASASKTSSPTKTPPNDGKLVQATTGPISKSADGSPQPEPDAEPNPTPGGKPGLSNVLGSLLNLGENAANAAAKQSNATAAASTSTTPMPAKGSNSAPASPSNANINTPGKPQPPAAAAPISLASRKSAPGGGSVDTAPLPPLDAVDPGRPAPLDPSVTPAYLASLGSGAKSALGSSAAKGQVPPVDPASAISEPRPLPLPLPVSQDDPAAGAPLPNSGSDEWGTIRRKLRSLGVTRYTIDGVPGGRVAFSCLIPLAGKQAVTQRFEAEGDDEIHAARTVLRRIALWQATANDRDRAAR